MQSKTPRSSFVVLLALVAACGGDSKDSGPTSGLTVWVRNIDGSNAVSLATTTDGGSNLLLAAINVGQADFGNGTVGTADTAGLVVAKYSPSKAYLWSQDFQGAFGNAAKVAVATDTDGDVLLALSHLEGAVSFAADPAPFTVSGSALVKLAGMDGAVRWAVSLDDSSVVDGSLTMQAAALAVDGNGDILVAGVAQALKDDSGTALVTPGPEELFLGKYAADGSDFVWTKRIGDAVSTAAAEQLAVSPTGELLVSARFTGVLPLGSGLDAQPYAPNSSFVVGRFTSSDGAPVWFRHLVGTSDAAVAPRLASDPSADVLVTGAFQAPDDSTDDNDNPPAQTVTVKLASDDGATIWRRTLGSTQAVLVPGNVASDSQGNVITTGAFNGVVDFDGFTMGSQGNKLNLYIYKRGPGGDPVWIRFAAANNGGDVTTTGLDTDTENAVLAAGVFNSFVNGSTTPNKEIFVLKLTP